MKKNIGLLICDTIIPELAIASRQYWESFNLLFETAETKIKLKKYDIRNGEWPKSPGECDGYVITGCVQSVNDPDPWIAELIHFIQQCYKDKIKMVGICFGHQIIAKAMGGIVTFNPMGWGVGLKKQEVLMKRQWMKPMQKKFNLIASHQEHVATLPSNAMLLCTSPHCEVAAFEIKDIFLGFQGHPENSTYTSGVSIEIKKDILTSEIYRLGKSSLTIEAEQKLIAKWINNFFHFKSK